MLKKKKIHTLVPHAGRDEMSLCSKNDEVEVNATSNPNASQSKIQMPCSLFI
jgi:hypothetical protein